jgi:penicillin amidase
MRPFAWRGLGVAAGATGALAAGAVGYLLRRALPQLDGEIRLNGLNAPIEIVRDRWGIPHVSARDEYDAFFAQGFCHAQDRLWQMELSRRLARGRLAEVLGEVALDVDRFMRRLGLHRAAQAEWEALSPATRTCLEAYVRGVNAAIDTLTRANLPIEFLLTRIAPTAWEPLDSLSYGRYLAFSLAPNWESELIRSRLVARLGYARASALEPDVWQPDSDALPRLEDWGPADMPEPGELPPLLLPGSPPGSNAWVISGARSSTGKPLLASDPHLIARFPSVFYEVHLAGGGDLQVAGASAPGIPGVLIGHNRHIAWGFTASMADVQDLYVERLDPGDQRRTEFAGRWETGTVVREIIGVKGRSQPWIEDVLLTAHHGPLLTPTPSLADEHRPLALRSMVLEAPTTLLGLLDLNRASGWDAFRAALSHWGTPSLNVLYADVEGNIGYQMVGHIPVRARGEGLVPSPGWSGQYEWTGTLAFDDLPRAFNPPDGLYANANQEVSGPDHAFFGREFVDPARYKRIRQVLESKERHSAVDFGALQADEVSLPGREIARLLVQLVQPRKGAAREALEELRAWDGRVSADSTAAAIYEVFRNELIAARHGRALGELLPAVLGVGPHPVLGAVSSHYFLQTRRVLDYLRSSPDVEVVQRAFEGTLRTLRRRLGPDLDAWQWGRLHPLRLEHSLSVRKPLGALFNVPPFAWGGDLETVRAGGHLPGQLAAGGPISAYRFIADCADWDNSLSCLPGGQSGHRGSPHYADQVEPWRRVAYHPLSFSRPAIHRHARHTLRLTPG